MNIFQRIVSICFILIVLPIQIVLNILGVFHTAIKTIVKVSEGQTLDQIYIESTTEQIDRLSDDMKNWRE